MMPASRNQPGQSSAIVSLPLFWSRLGAIGQASCPADVAGNAIIRAISKTRTDPTPLTLDDLDQAKAVIAAPIWVALCHAALRTPPAPTLGPCDNDARHFLTDPDFFLDLNPALLEPHRLDRLAQLISANRNPRRPDAFRLSEAPRGLTTLRDRRINPSTASILVVDQPGHEVALSTTLSYSYGSGIAALEVTLNSVNVAFNGINAMQG
jgi:gamma-glutamyltranspeptidase